MSSVELVDIVVVDVAGRKRIAQAVVVAERIADVVVVVVERIADFVVDYIADYDVVVEQIDLAVVLLALVLAVPVGKATVVAVDLADMADKLVWAAVVTRMD
jgi:hypothetical protein